MRKLGSAYTYFDCFIYRNTEPGYKLRWSASTPYRTVSADTLEGIKRLIRDDCLTTAEKARREAKETAKREQATKEHRAYCIEQLNKLGL